MVEVAHMCIMHDAFLPRSCGTGEGMHPRTSKGLHSVDTCHPVDSWDPMWMVRLAHEVY